MIGLYSFQLSVNLFFFFTSLVRLSKTVANIKEPILTRNADISRNSINSKILLRAFNLKGLVHDINENLRCNPTVPVHSFAELIKPDTGITRAMHERRALRRLSVNAASSPCRVRIV